MLYESDDLGFSYEGQLRVQECVCVCVDTHVQCVHTLPEHLHKNSDMFKYQKLKCCKVYFSVLLYNTTHVGIEGKCNASWEV